MESRTIEFTLSPDMLQSLTDLFEMEVEILQGEKKELENGLIWLKVTLTGYKLEIFKDFFRLLVSTPSSQITVTHRGIIISQN